MKTTEFVINSNGAFERVDITRTPLAVTEETFAPLGARLARQVANVHHIEGFGNVSLSVTAHLVYATIGLRSIHLRAPFRMVDGVLVPNLSSTSTDQTMQLMWMVPQDMRVAMMIELSTATDYRIKDIWIFAIDAGQRLYRLPLSNLYTDCRLCSGEFPRSHVTLVKAVTAALVQFSASEWNSDLLESPETTQQFFRFKPTNAGFETLPISTKDWTALCQKVGVEIANHLVL